MLHRALLIGLATTVLMFASSLAAEGWGKKACKQAEKKNRRAYRVSYKEKFTFKGMLNSMGGATTSCITFHLVSPEGMKSLVCDSKDVGRLTPEEAEALYQQRLAAHRLGYIPVLIQIKNQVNGPHGLSWEYGGDASEARGVYLQDKNNRHHFLREVEGKREELFLGYDEWSRTWQGSLPVDSLIVLFPYDAGFFSRTKRIEVEIRYGGVKGKKKRRRTFPKKMGQLLVEQMAALGGRPAVGFKPEKSTLQE